MRVILTFFKVYTEFIERGSSASGPRDNRASFSSCAVSAREFASGVASQRMHLCLLTSQGEHDT